MLLAEALHQKQVDPVLGLLGSPYLHGGSDPKTGIDCWGLVMHLYRSRGIELPDYRNGSISSIPDQWHAVLLMATDPATLYVVTFKGAFSHVGILYDGKVIHSRDPIGVVISPISRIKHRLKGVYQWIS